MEIDKINKKIVISSNDLRNLNENLRKNVSHKNTKSTKNTKTGLYVLSRKYRFRKTTVGLNNHFHQSNTIIKVTWIGSIIKYLFQKNVLFDA